MADVPDGAGADWQDLSRAVILRRRAREAAARHATDDLQTAPGRHRSAAAPDAVGRTPQPASARASPPAALDRRAQAPQRSARHLLQGRYSLGEIIGSGGMAVVYRGVDELLGRRVAIKLFTSAARTREELQVQEREARLLASMSHHGLVTLLDAGVELADGSAAQVYLVMEQVVGTDLKRRLEAGPLPARHVAHIGFDVAEALEYVHAQGVAHRDIKPANVLLVDYQEGVRPRAKLADFGIATLVHAERPTANGVVRGTAAYLAPEQVDGGPVGTAADVYSLGLVLLQALTGEVAFPGTVSDSALARLDRDPPVPPSVPVPWRRLLTRMTDRDATLRPTPTQVAQSLRELILLDEAAHSATGHVAVVDIDADPRLQRRYDLRSTEPDGAYDHITAIVRRTVEVPAAALVVIEDDVVVIRSLQGMPVDALAADPGFFALPILRGGSWHATDTRADLHTMQSPLVTGPMPIRAVAGVPIVVAKDGVTGALCALDTVPHEFRHRDLETIADLAALVAHEMELRLATRRALFRG